MNFQEIRIRVSLQIDIIIRNRYANPTQNEPEESQENHQFPNESLSLENLPVEEPVFPAHREIFEPVIEQEFPVNIAPENNQVVEEINQPENLQEIIDNDPPEIFHQENLVPPPPEINLNDPEPLDISRRQFWTRINEPAAKSTRRCYTNAAPNHFKQYLFQL